MSGAWRSGHGWPGPRIFLIPGNRGHSIWIDLNDWRGFFNTGRRPTHAATQYGGVGLAGLPGWPAQPDCALPDGWVCVGSAEPCSAGALPGKPPAQRGCTLQRPGALFRRLMLRRRMHQRKLSCFTWIDLNSQGRNPGRCKGGCVATRHRRIGPAFNSPRCRDHAQVFPRSLPCRPAIWASVLPCPMPASFLIPALSPPSLSGWAGHQRPGFGRATLSPYRHRPTGSST